MDPSGEHKSEGSDSEPEDVPAFSRKARNRPIDIFFASYDCLSRSTFFQKLKKMPPKLREEARMKYKEAMLVTKIKRKEYVAQKREEDKKKANKVLNTDKRVGKRPWVPPNPEVVKQKRKAEKKLNMEVLHTAQKEGVLPYIPAYPDDVRAKTSAFIQKGVFSLTEGDVVAMAAVNYPRSQLERRHQDQIREYYLKYHKQEQNPPCCLHGFFLFSGVVVLPVLDQDSKNRIAKLIEEMPPLRDGTKLKVLDNAALCKFWILRLFLPGQFKSSTEVLRKLAVQNPALKVEEWTLKSYKICDPNKFFLTLKIPVAALKALGLMKFQVCYNLETTRANFIIDNEQRTLLI